jgi:hypothetical protein
MARLPPSVVEDFEGQACKAHVMGAGQGLALVHFSAQPEPFLTRNTPKTPLDTLKHLPNIS